MKKRLLKILKFVAAPPLLITLFIAAPLTSAYAEELSLFRSPESGVHGSGNLLPTIKQQNHLRVDKKGDLLIQYGKAHFTVAYNEPADQFKPSGQQYNPQRGQNAVIIGISLTATLAF